MRDPSPAGPIVSEAAGRDSDVVAMLAAGDIERAFENLVARYETKVFHLCRSLLRDVPAAQDAAQDSFLRVWRALSRYDPSTAALSTWIYAITRNRCLSMLARKEPDNTSLTAPEVQAEAEQVPAPAAQSESIPVALLRHLVDDLAPAYRASLVLYYFEERSIAEVAAMLAIPESTVKTHLYRARAALLRRLRAIDLANASVWL